MSEKVKVLFTGFVLCLISMTAFSQSHFIFIQSENKQAFTVSVSAKNYGSSGSGYVIIPQLNSGEYFLDIKSAANQQLLGTYKVVIAYNDLGFNLKEDGGSWVLENVQSKSILKNWVPEPTEEKKKPAAGSGFGDMLSQVVNDPNLNKKKETEKPVVVSDSAVAVNVSDKTTKEPISESDSTPAINTSGVIKNSEDQKTEGLNIVFVEFTQTANDTISIVIPTEGSAATDSTGKLLSAAAEKQILKAESSAVDSVKTESVTKIEETQIPIKQAEIKNETTAADTLLQKIDSPAANAVEDSVTNPFHKPKLTIDSTSVEKLYTDSAKSIVNPAINPECKGIASNDDFIRLRRKMAAQDNDEEMIDAAKKAFKSKCYTTDQIKNLGSLFLNDQSRYAFFDAAYAYVFDPGNFASLESQLIEDYYKKRFRAMIH